MIYQQRNNPVETHLLANFIKRVTPEIEALGTDASYTKRVLDESLALDAARSTPQTRENVSIRKADAERVGAKHKRALADLDALRAALVKFEAASLRTCNAGEVAALLTEPLMQRAWVYASHYLQPIIQGAA